MRHTISAAVIVLIALMSPAAGQRTAPTVTMQARTYHLGSFHEKPQPTWEFVTGSETVDNWTSLITVIDRPDAHTQDELGRLAEGILQNYKSHGGQILSAKPLRDKTGAIYNYIVAAFEEPPKHRYEINFVRVAQGPKNAIVVIYGARVGAPVDYQRKAKDFLNQQSGPIGDALEKVPLPDIGKLPRKEF